MEAATPTPLLPVSLQVYSEKSLLDALWMIMRLARHPVKMCLWASTEY